MSAVGRICFALILMCSCAGTLKAQVPVSVDLELLDATRKSVTLDNRLTLGESATLRLAVTAPLEAEGGGNA